MLLSTSNAKFNRNICCAGEQTKSTLRRIIATWLRNSFASVHPELPRTESHNVPLMSALGVIRHGHSHNASAVAHALAIRYDEIEFPHLLSADSVLFVLDGILSSFVLAFGVLRGLCYERNHLMSRRHVFIHGRLNAVNWARNATQRTGYSLLLVNGGVLTTSCGHGECECCVVVVDDRTVVLVQLASFALAAPASFVLGWTHYNSAMWWFRLCQLC